MGLSWKNFKVIYENVNVLRQKIFKHCTKFLDVVPNTQPWPLLWPMATFVFNNNATGLTDDSIKWKQWMKKQLIDI